MTDFVSYQAATDLHYLDESLTVKKEIQSNCNAFDEEVYKALESILPE